MKEWKFLLQKDGDRSWLPLDSADVEILEGRYRIVAQTDRPNTDISIRICHLATEEDPPKRRIQKRSNRTNRNGLMVVAPFTHLQPGNWELCCFLTDPMSHLVGDMLHQAVRLRVSACVEDEDALEWNDPPEAGDLSASPEADLSSSPETIAVGGEDLKQGEDADSMALPLVSEAETLVSAASPSTQDIAALNVEIAQALGVSMDRLVEMTDQLSHQLIEEIFKEFNLPAIVEPLEAQVSSAMPEGQPAIVASADLGAEEESPIYAESGIDVNQVQMVLTQDIWMASRGESLAIVGRLESAAVSPADQEVDGRMAAVVASHDPAQLEANLEGAIPKELQIQLRDPQTSAVVFHACQSFPTAALPFPFTFLCQLPEDLTTHLLIGEVVIAGVLPGAESVLITLKTAPFTITVDPQGLVEELQKVKTALAKNAEQEELPDLVAQFSQRLMQQRVGHDLDLSFLNMAAPVTEPVANLGEEIASSGSAIGSNVAPKKQILPPQIYQPDAEQAGKRKLELPVFAGVGAKASGTTIAAEPELTTADVVFASSDAELESMLLPDLPDLLDFNDGSAMAMDTDVDRATIDVSDAASVESSDPQQPEPEEGAVNDSPSPNSNDGREDLARIEELASPIRSAFQALNLQDKFLNRLSSMASDSELTTLLKLTLPQPEVVEVSQEGVSAEVEPLPIAEVVAEPNTTEVVVDDDPTWREWVKRAGSRMKPLETNQDSLTDHPLMLPADEVVPMPHLETGIDEIVAGKPINVRVKLPNLLPKIYVKLWVNDRQTRTLLDGPRWLVDFLPNGFDELEASTQITVPLGSLNIRIEAIAVEIQTQRESQKIVLDCEVTPTDLPDDLFEGLDY